MLVAIDDDDEPLPCRRAFSCLVAPETGDRVAVCVTGYRLGFVVAILERPQVTMTRISIEGDLLLEATRDLRFHAAHQCAWRSDGELSVEAERVVVSATHTELASGSSAVACDELHGRIGVARLIGKTLETVVERVVQLSRTSFRSIESVDHVRAAHVDYAATDTLRLHGKNTLLTAEHLSKIDAAQIHLG